MKILEFEGEMKCVNEEWFANQFAAKTEEMLVDGKIIKTEKLCKVRKPNLNPSFINIRNDLKDFRDSYHIVHVPTGSLLGRVIVFGEFQEKLDDWKLKSLHVVVSSDLERTLMKKCS